MIKKFVPFILLVVILSSCASKKFKDVQYIPQQDTREALSLNVFQPRDKKAENLPVVIFVHGGYWTEGDKNIYGFLGRNFSKNDVITVIPSYTLSPKANYDTMAQEIVKALDWTIKNIKDFKGNPDQIYLMGHSAGGHLIALISTNPKYLENTKAIKGVILNDAAGLDMYSYLQHNPPTRQYNYITTWTKNPEEWKNASPIYFVDENSPPFLIYVGEKSYPSIIEQNSVFVKKLNDYQPKVKQIFLNKKHVPMMSQYFFPWTNRYHEIMEFINNN